MNSIFLLISWCKNVVFHQHHSKVHAFVQTVCTISLNFFIATEQQQNLEQNLFTALFYHLQFTRQNMKTFLTR